MVLRVVLRVRVRVCGDGWVGVFVRVPAWWSPSLQEQCPAREANCSLRRARESIAQLAFLGVTDLWDLSMLVLHHKVPHFEPLRSNFGMFNPKPAAHEEQAGDGDTGHAGNRKNANPE